MVNTNPLPGSQSTCPNDTNGDGDCPLCCHDGKCRWLHPDPAHCCGCCSANWLCNQFSSGCPECEAHFHNHPAEKCKNCGGPLERDREIEYLCCVCTNQIKKAAGDDDHPEFLRGYSGGNFLEGGFIGIDPASGPDYSAEVVCDSEGNPLYQIVHGKKIMMTPTVQIDSEEKLLEHFGKSDSMEKFPPPDEGLPYPGVVRVDSDQWGLHDDICASRRGGRCNCPIAAFDSKEFRAKFLDRQPAQMSSLTFWLLAGGLVLLILYMTMELL